MATRRESNEPKEVDFNDKSLQEAKRSGDGSKLPENVIIRSPYGRGRDIGAQGDARGDDENTGSERA